MFAVVVSCVVHNAAQVIFCILCILHGKTQSWRLCEVEVVVGIITTTTDGTPEHELGQYSALWAQELGLFVSVFEEPSSASNFIFTYVVQFTLEN